MSALEKLLAALVASGVLVMGYGVWQAHQQAIGEQRATTYYTAAINAQKRNAAAQLASETAKAGAASQALQDFKTQQEKKDAENQSAIDGLAARLRAAATAGRLRDPNARAAGCGIGGGGAQAADPGSASGGAADTAEADGLFSAGATELFQRLTGEADAINVAYASCRADAVSLRQVLD